MVLIQLFHSFLFFLKNLDNLSLIYEIRPAAYSFEGYNHAKFQHFCWEAKADRINILLPFSFYNPPAPLKYNWNLINTNIG